MNLIRLTYNDYNSQSDAQGLLRTPMISIWSRHDCQTPLPLRPGHTCAMTIKRSSRPALRTTAKREYMRSRTMMEEAAVTVMMPAVSSVLCESGLVKFGSGQLLMTSCGGSKPPGIVVVVWL